MLLHAQTRSTTDSSTYKTIAAGPEYKKAGFYSWLWGTNRRKEWTTPVRVPLLWLDTAFGGLKPYQKGGGNETRSLRLLSHTGKEYSLRSINKSRDDVVPPETKGTFIEDIIQDGVSMSYPYAAFAVPGMQQQSGIYHTNPQLVYLPQQPALDSFNQRFANDLYLLEQRPDGDWTDADNLGNFSKFSSTEKLIQKILGKPTHIYDQHAFVRARLFDMLIADWDRHEDNWRWGVTDTMDVKWYTPVPRDRDQAFYTHNGLLIDRILQLSGLHFMQNFTFHLQEAHKLNMEERNIDRFFTNRLTQIDWETAATQMKQSLTDAVIEASVKGLPPEIFRISGEEMIAKLKSRRNELVDYAREYYRFIAQEVEVPGTQKKDYFEVSEAGGYTLVRVYYNKGHQRADTPYYSRSFNPQETRELRLYGVDENDVFDIRGKSNGIKLRIIGGPQKDSVVQIGGDKIYVYDNDDNVFQTTSAKLKLSDDSAVHVYNYAGYNYNVRQIIPYIFFNSTDIWYIGINHMFVRHKWRREPFANKRTIGINYSGSKRALSINGSILYPNTIGKWDLLLAGRYDGIKWTNYFGTGNDTKLTTEFRPFNRARSTDWTASAGLSAQFGKSSFDISAVYQQSRILNDTGRFVGKTIVNENGYKANHYGGGQLTYSFVSVNDSIVPTSGVTLLGRAGNFRNISLKDVFERYEARLQGFVPLGNKFSLAIVLGGKAISGNNNVVNNAQWFQHAIIGGPENMRGYRAERFWGKSAVYNKNELRFITNLRSRLMNGKVGLLLFEDNGRVWLPGETSNTIHSSYGGGIIIVPFYKINTSFTYGITSESRLFQLSVSTLL